MFADPRPVRLVLAGLLMFFVGPLVPIVQPISDTPPNWLVWSCFTLAMIGFVMALTGVFMRLRALGCGGCC